MSHDRSYCRLSFASALIACPALPGIYSVDCSSKCARLVPIIVVFALPTLPLLVIKQCATLANAASVIAFTRHSIKSNYWLSPTMITLLKCMYTP